MLTMVIGEGNKKSNGAEGEKVRGYRKIHIYELHVCAPLQILLERSSERE